MRRRRFELFLGLLKEVPRPARILDVGGTQRFWDVVGFRESDFEVVLLNRIAHPASRAGFTSVVGDARAMPEFANREFDVVFSNSVIEHLENLQSQRAMADEVVRVGQRFWIQTPNRYFPMEAHALLPFFQFLPKPTQVQLAKRLRPGWYRGLPDSELVSEVSVVRLLNARELKALFPGAVMWRERFFGLTKSLVVHKGFAT